MHDKNHALLSQKYYHRLVEFLRNHLYNHKHHLINSMGMFEELFK